MAEDFTRKSSPKLDALVNAARTVEEMREAMKGELARTGQMVRGDRGNDYGAGSVAQPEPLPAVEPRYPFSKEVHFHPSLRKRSLVIRATSQADLDALERQVTE